MNDANPVIGEDGVLDGSFNFRHVAGCTVLRAYGAGRAGVVGSLLRVWLVDVALQTA